jgi:hypothetical protein
MKLRRLAIGGLFAAGALVTPLLVSSSAGAAPNATDAHSCVPLVINLNGGAPDGAPGHFTSKSDFPFGQEVSAVAHCEA